MKSYFAILFSAFIFFGFVIYFSFKIDNKLSEYKDIKEDIAKQLNFKERILNGWEWLPGNEIGKSKREYWEKQETKADNVYGFVNRYSIFLILTVVIFVVFNVLFYQYKPIKYNVYGLLMVFSAFAFLFIGLKSPFIEIFAYSRDFTVKFPIDINLNDYPLISMLDLGEWGKIKYNFEATFEGRTYYMYQNKSIVNLLEILYTGGNFIVAIMVGLFSVIFPIVKLTSSIFIIFNPHSKRSQSLFVYIKNLGKWSMADVFIAAIFLSIFAYTSLNVGVETGARTLYGTYYFLLFVLLSIGSGYYINKVLVVQKF
ncbi:paraquat-inducible protein A [Crocinitomix catalasitica]|uniref:paraquat-inducible protein A n=1 Tax=Crocinitomix catalasitica TaxID=184607 RepID=UPI00048182C2|nr:paraquat-inducible protein A [Crocinitomix catalasitica]